MKPNQSIIFELVFKLTFVIGCMISVQRSIIGAWSNILSATRKVTCTMYKQDTKHTILCYVNKVRSMFLFTSGQYSGKSSFFKLIFFSLPVRFEHKIEVLSICRFHFRSKTRIFLSTFQN